MARRRPPTEGLGDRIDYRQADLNAVELEPELRRRRRGAGAPPRRRPRAPARPGAGRSARGGLFVVNEYIGPARFQWLDKTEALMNRILDVLPEDNKLNPFNGFVKERRPAPPRGDRRDRPLGVDSLGRDRPAAESRFEVLYRADFGGTLLQFLLADIAANFSEDEPMDVALLDLMSLFEEVLIAERVLPSDFAFFVLSPTG